MKKKRNGFSESWEFIWAQTKKPLGESTFWMYLFLGVIILGGLGFWFELGKYLLNPILGTDSLKSSLILFAPPLINAAAIQLCLSKRTVKLSTKSTIILFTTLVDIGCIVLILGNPTISSGLFLTLMPFIIFISIWIAWIHSSLNDDLYDNPPDDAALGGNTHKPLSGGIPSDFTF